MVGGKGQYMRDAYVNGPEQSEPARMLLVCMYEEEESQVGTLNLRLSIEAGMSFSPPTTSTDHQKSRRV